MPNIVILIKKFKSSIELILWKIQFDIKEMEMSHVVIILLFVFFCRSDGNDNLLERMNALETLMLDLRNDNAMLKEKVSSLETENKEFKNTISFLKKDNEKFKKISNVYYNDAKHGNDTFPNKRITIPNRKFLFSIIDFRDTL